MFTNKSQIMLQLCNIYYSMMFNFTSESKFVGLGCKKVPQQINTDV